MDEMISGDQDEDKGDGIVTNVAFSRIKPGNSKYADYHEKIWTYVELIWHEARAIDPSCDPRNSKPILVVVEAQKRVFRYPDMATTRAGIGAATEKLTSKKIGIIGVGGTGSYILDLIAKTPVEEIHIFDNDEFELHNAYRAPGRICEENEPPKKVDWFGEIYDRMHLGIKRHPYKILAENIGELAGFDFIFVAVDDGVARKVILEGLIAMSVPFVDVGMDLSLDFQNSLRGQTRFTVGTPQKNDHISEVVSFETSDQDEIYKNIQVADLNMLNAAMAVGKWKQMAGFYADDMHEHHSLYSTSRGIEL